MKKLYSKSMIAVRPDMNRYVTVALLALWALPAAGQKYRLPSVSSQFRSYLNGRAAAPVLSEIMRPLADRDARAMSRPLTTIDRQSRSSSISDIKESLEYQNEQRQAIYTRDALRRALLSPAHPESTTRLDISFAPSKKQLPGLGRSVALFLGGMVGSFAAFWVTGTLIDDAIENDRVDGDAGYNRTKNVLAVLSSAVGATAGVTAVGALSRPRGSIAWTAAGAGIGAVPFLLAYDSGNATLFNLVFGVPLQSFGAMVGFSLSLP